MNLVLPTFVSALGSKMTKIKNLCSLVALLLLVSSGTWAQSTANYAFSTNATGSLALLSDGTTAVDMTTGTTQLVGSSSDATASSVFNIGFNYTFMGVNFSQFSATADGMLNLGATANSGTTLNATGVSSTTPRISAFGGDLYVGSTGKVHYKLFGTSPNRVLVVEWTNMALFYGTTAANANSTFQVRLYETTGVVEYVYGAMNITSTTYSPGYIGFSTNSTTAAGNILCVNSATNSIQSTSALTTSINGGSYTTGVITNLNSTSNGSRRVYRFTPPSGSSLAAPIATTVTAVSTSGMTLNWDPASPTTGILGYAVLRSTDNITFTPVATVALGTNTYIATNLTPSTNYYFKVYSTSEGGLSASSANFTQATNSPVTYVWNQTGTAAFSTASNWTPNGVPAAGDNITFNNDATTTVTGIPAQSLNNITVSGTTTNVTFQTAAASTIGVIGSLSIAEGTTLNLNSANAIGLTINSGGTASISGTLNLSNSNATYTTTGNTTVNSRGVINNAGAISGGTATTLTFAASSVYNHSRDGGTIPTATYNAASTINVTGIVGTSPTPPSTVGNFNWNCPNQTIAATLSSTLTSATGSVTITNTGVGSFQWGSAPTTTITGLFTIGSAANYLNPGTITCNGGFTMNSGAILSGTGAGSHVIGTGTNLTLNSGATISATGAQTFVMNGTGAQNATLACNISGLVNFTIAATSNTTLLGSNINAILNNLTINATSATVFGTLATAADQTLTVNGTATFGTGAFNGTLSGAGNLIVSASGSLVVNGSGPAIQSGGAAVGTSGTVSVVSGNITLSGTSGTVAQTFGSNFPTPLTIGSVTLNNATAGGAFTIDKSVSLNNFTITAGTTTVPSGITVTGNAVTTLSNTAGILAVNGAFTQNSLTGIASTITFGATATVTGTGTFNLNSGATLLTANTAGITASGATGSVQTTTRNFASGANYTFNGSAYTTGNGMPATISGNVTIDGSTSATLSSSYTFNGQLNLKLSMAIGSNSVTIGSTGILTTTNSNLTGIGSFITNSGATVSSGTTSTNNGIFSGSTSGTIQTTTQTISTGTNVIYTGSSALTTMGTKCPTTLGSLTLTSSGSIALAVPLSVTNLSFTSTGLINTTATNLLTVTGTAANSIVRSTTSTSGGFVVGPLARTYPASLSGGNYLYPIGKGTTYEGFELVNPIFNATGSSTIQMEGFTTAPGATTFGSGLSTPYGAFYWAQTVSGTGGLVSVGNIRVTTSALTATQKLGQSATLTGAYTSVGGTFLSGSLLSGATINTASRYFAVAVGAASGTFAAGTYAVGPAATYSGYTGSYFSITAALAAMAETTALAGPVVIELQPDYASTVEAYPLNFTSVVPTTSTNTVTIRPAAAVSSVINFNPAGGVSTAALWDFNGGKNFIIDGRNGGTGTNRFIAVNNLGNAPAIRLINNAQNNNFSYLQLASSNTSTSSGVVAFSTAASTTATDGNNNNTIDNCYVDAKGISPNGIYASGSSSPADNKSNILTNNRIFDFYLANGTHAGILVGSGNTTWTIGTSGNGNSIYQTATRIPTLVGGGTTWMQGIRINNTSGNGFSVIGNRIGGNIPGIAGSLMDYGSATQLTTIPNAIYPIVIDAGSTTASTVDSNFISDINLYSSSTSGSTIWFSGINVNTGLVNITNNTIGSQSTTGNINFVWRGAGTATPNIYSIWAGNGTAYNGGDIKNNSIGGITTTADLSTTNAITFAGILVNTTTATAAIAVNNNLIGSTLVTNSILHKATSKMPATQIGIQFAATTNLAAAGGTINNNTIANITNATSFAYTNNTMYGLNLASTVVTAGPLTITGNTVRNLTTSSLNTNLPAASLSTAINGMAFTASGTGLLTIGTNTVHSLNNTNNSAAPLAVVGIYYNVSNTGGTIFERNFVHSLATGTNAAAWQGGIVVGGSATGTTFRNNIIRMGINADGSSNSVDARIFGMYKTTSTAYNLWHNSVYVGGSNVASNSANTAAFYKSATSGADVIQNNIFVNTRSNASGSAKHYATSYANIAGLTPVNVNYNDLFVNGTGGVLANNGLTDYTTFRNWKSGSTLDANSVNGDPQFIAPNGTNTTLDLHISPTALTQIEASGLAIASITNDFDGNTRANLTPVDMGAMAGNYVPQDVTPPGISFTALENSSCTSVRTLSSFATITDASGINTTAGTSPRIYFKKSTNADTYNDNTSATDGWKYVEASSTTSPFTLAIDPSLIYGGSVATGDVIQYFVVAQDTPSTGANVGISNGLTFALAPSSVALTSDVFPLTGTLKSYTITSAIAPIVSIGAGRDYPTLTGVGGLFEAINAGGLSDDTVATIVDASVTETGATALNQIIYGCTANKTLTIRPFINSTLTGSVANGAIIKLNGADNVIIDGTNKAGIQGTLTITNTSATSSAMVWVGSANATNGANNNTVKNCIISGDATTPAIIGIVVGSGTTFGNAAETPNNNLTIQNNKINTAQNGIYFSGNATTLDSGLNINNNSIGSNVAANKMTFRGAFVYNAQSFTINNNTILGVTSSTSSSSSMFGLQLGGTALGTGTIYNNKISDIKQNNTSGYYAYGLYLSPTTTSGAINIYNNVITDVASYYLQSGIYLSSGSTYNFYHNTIDLNTTLSTTNYAYNMYVSSSVTGTGLKIQNNIFSNSTNNAYKYAIYSAAAKTVYAAIGNNDYYVSGTLSGTVGLGYIGATSYYTLANMATNFGDLNSISANPNFVSSTVLTPSTGSPVVNAGTPISTYTTDIVGATRSSTTPTIGAYETAYTLPTATFSLVTPVDCTTAVDHTISVSGTAGTGALSYATVTYKVNGGTTNTVTLSPSGTNSWSGTILAATPANGTITYSYSVTDVNGISSTTGTGSYLDNGLSGITITASASPATVCAGSNSTLSLAGSNISTGTVTVGTGLSLTGASSTPTAFNNYNLSYHSQTIYSAADLTAAGLTAGNITSMAYKITTLGDAATNAAFTVKMGSITTPDFGTSTSYVSTSNFTTVFPSATYTHTSSGLQTINFSTPYNWDGTSNIIIDVTHSGADLYANSRTYYTTTTANTTISNTNDITAVSGTASTQRLDLVFAGNKISTTIPSAISWSNGTTTLGTNNNLSVSPTTSTTYTATATINGCATTANTTVNVQALPTAPLATDASRCGKGIVTDGIVTSTSGATTPTFKWYAADTGGTALQSSTSPYYTTAITQTKTFYVTELVGTCESSPRTPITLTVNAPPTLTVAITAGNQINCGTSQTFNVELTANSDDADMTYSWSSDNSGVFPGDTSSQVVSASVTQSTIFTVTGTPRDPGCDPITVQFPVSVYPLPNATVTTTATGVCPGTSATINSGLSSEAFSATCITAPTALATSPATAVTLINGSGVQVTTGAYSTTGIDDNYWSVPIGFDFNFLGTNYNSIYVTTNGILSFTAGTTSFSFPSGFPSTSSPAGAIAVCGRDLHFTAGSNGTLKYWVEGLAPNRRFIVQYADVNSYDTRSQTTEANIGKNSAEAVFYETLGNVEIRVIKSNNGNSTAANSINKLIGLQNAAQTIGAVAPRCTPSTPNYWNAVTTEILTPQAWKFTPPSNYLVTWSTVGAGNVLSTIGTADTLNNFSINVTPNTTTIYDLHYTNTTTGCSNLVGSDRVTMSVLSPISPTTTAEASIATVCKNGSSNLTLTGNVNSIGNTDGLTYQWQVNTGSGFFDYTGTGAATKAITVTPTVASTYQCLVSVCGGTPVASSPVTVNITPDFTLDQSALTICAGASSSTVNIATAGSSYDRYSWIPDTGVSGNSTDGWVFNPADSTVYTLTASQSTGNLCSTTATVSVTVNTTSVTATGTPTSVCSGDTVTLNASSIVSGSTNLPSGYCAPDSSGGAGSSPITSVTFNTLSNTNITNVYPYYTTYPATGTLTTNVLRGNTYTLSLDASSSITSVWIDYNRNGSFETSEWTQVWTDASTGSVSITIPSNAKVGATKMRIRSRGSLNPNGSSDACSIFYSGVSQDYTITIQKGTPDNTFAWTSSPSGLSASGASVTVNPTVDTVYSVVATNPTTGCSSTPETVSVSIKPNNTAGPASATPSVNINTAITAITHATTGATGIGAATNLPPGVTATWASNVITITGRPTATGTFDYSIPLTGGCGTVSATGTITVISTAPPTALAQTFCNSATVADLVATGTDIKWYAAATGGSALASNVAIATGTYYATQTLNTFESDRTPVAITLNTTSAPSATSQTFCTSGSVADLVATGTDLKWYAAATGGSALASDVALATGNYYVSQTLNSCESARTLVTVTVNVTPAPTAASQSFCNSGTVANLVATGTALKWYAAATGGSALASDVALATGSYYVSQTLNSCESTRTLVTVTVNVTPAPTASAQTFCNSGTVANLIATGTGLDWYAAANGGSALASTTQLASGNYYVTQTINDCQSDRLLVEVTLNIPAAPAAESQVFCTSANATVANLVASGTDIKWYSAATGGSALASDVALTAGNYYVSQTLNSCESASRTQVAVSFTNGIAVQPVDTNICTTATTSLASISVVSYGGTPTYTWQYATAAAPTNWVTITAANAGTIYTTYSSATLNIKKAATLLTGTKYRVTLTNGLCGAVTSNEVTLTVNPITVVKAITASPASICTGSGSTLTLATGSVGSIQWQKSTISDTAGFENVGAVIAATAATNGVVTLPTGNITQDTWYRIVFSSGACSTATSAAVKVTVTSALPDLSLTTAADSVCTGSGTILTLGESTGTIAWYKSTNYVNTTNAAPTWTLVPLSATVTSSTLATGNLTYAAATPTTWYRAVATSGACFSNSNVVSVTVSPLAVAKAITASPATICTGSGATLTLATASVGSIQWQKSTTSATDGFDDLGSIIAPTSATNGVVTLPTGTLEQDTWYRIVFTNGACSTISAAVKVTVSPAATVGELTTAATTVCTASGTNLTLGDSSGTVAWYKSTNFVNTTSATAVWTLVPLSTTVTSSTLATGNLTYSAATPTTWYKAVVTSGACNISSNVVSVTVSPLAVAKAITASPATICTGSSTTLTLATASVGSIQWQKSITSATDGFDDLGDVIPATTATNGVVTLSTGPLDQDTWYRIVFTNGACYAFSTAVKVTVSPAASAGELTTALDTVCTATGTDLTLGDSTGTVAWYKSTNYVNTTGAAATWTLVPLSATVTSTALATGNLTYSAATPTTWYRAVATSGACISPSNVVSVTVSPAAVAKAITASKTTICTGSSTTLTLATASVGSIQWQMSTTSATDGFGDIGSEIAPTSATNGVVTLSTEPLEQDTWYRIIFTNGACYAISAAVKVTVSPAASIGELSTAASTVCTGSGTNLTLDDSTGTVAWYKSTNYVNTTGAAATWTLVPLSATVTSTALATGNLTYAAATPTTWYRAVATSGACISPSNVVSVTVSPAAVAKAITATTATICTGSSTTLTLATASVGSIQWQKSITSSTEGFDNFGSVIVPTTATNGVATISTGSLTQDTWFRVVFTNGACSVNSAAVKVTVSPAATAGQLTTAAATVCTGTGTTLSLGESTGTVAWYKSTNYVNSTGAAATWTLVPLSATVTSTSLATGSLAYLATTPITWYRAVATSGACISPSNVVSVTVSPAAVAKAITATTATICTGSSTTLTLATASVGSIQWQKSITSSTEGFDNFGSVIAPTTATNGVATVSTGSLTQDTWFRVVFTNGACSVYSAAIKVTVSQAATAGQLTTAADTVCTSSGTTLTLGTSTGTVAWYKSTNYVNSTSAAATWTLVPLSATVTSTSLSTGSLTYVATTPITWYRAVATSGACTSPSNVVSVTVSPAAKVTAITGFNTATTQVCVGTPKTLSLTTGYIGTIEWLSSTSLTGTYTVIPGATGPTYNYTPTSTATMYFKVRMTSSPCSLQATSTAGVAVFAKNCTVTSKALTPFAVKAYPNPYASSFQLDFTTSSETQIEMRVYDMIGKLIETRQFSTSEMNNQEVGDNYPSGVYNVIVTQGEEMKTLRVIKK